MSILVALGLGAEAGCGPASPSETQRNAELRQALRGDPAFRLLPSRVRSSLSEYVAHSSGFNGPQVGSNGFSGVEPAPANVQPDVLLRFWDADLRGAGWSLSGGECRQPGDPAQREVGGVWTKHIQGRWAFFHVVVEGPNVGYGMFIRAIADSDGAAVNLFGNVQPASVGCKS